MSGLKRLLTTHSAVAAVGISTALLSVSVCSDMGGSSDYMLVDDEIVMVMWGTCMRRLTAIIWWAAREEAGSRILCDFHTRMLLVACCGRAVLNVERLNFMYGNKNVSCLDLCFGLWLCRS